MDDNFQLNTHLHYGAIIHISCFRDKTNFYLYSNGISFRSMIALAANDGPTQSSMALFKLTPTIKFQSQQFLQQLLKQRYELEGGVSISQEQTKIFIDQFEFELSQNNNLIKQQNKFPIKYNEDFMLQHIYSSKYLTYMKNQKTNEFILQLLEIPTKFSIFNLESCFNYQKDINVYIPFNSAAFLNIKIYEGLQIKDYYLNFKKNSIFDTWTTSEEEKQQISIGLYQTAEQMQYKNISYGDTVWIFHLQSGSFVKLIQPNEVQSFILKKINFALGRVKNDEEMKEDKAAPETITAQIFLQKTQNQTSAEKFGLWKIIYAKQKSTNIINRKQHFDRFKGGKVRFDQQVRFYNIRHQVYLSVRKVKISRNKFKFVLATQKSEEDNTAFKIKSLSPNSIYATTEDLFLIQHVLSQTYLTLSQPFKINQNQAYLSPQSQFKKEDNFKFTKIQFIQEWQNNNILSILPFIREGIKVFQQNNKIINARQQVILQLLTQNLIQLLSFSYDLTQGFQASSNKLGKMTYNHYQIQRLLKEQGIIKLLVYLLSRIDSKALEDAYEVGNTNKDVKQIFKIKGSIKIVKQFTAELLNDQKNIRIDIHMVRKIVNLCLKILRNCCKSNNQNSLLLFNQIPIFVKFLSLQTYAQQFFIDSFSKLVILEKMSAKEFSLIFQQYLKIYNIKKVHTTQFFQLVIKMFLSDEESVGKNQLQAFLLTFQNNNPLIIPIECYNQCFYINYYGKRYEMKQFSLMFPHQTSVLAAQINFFAYLTFNRNYVCSKKTKELFPLDVLVNYITSDLFSQIKASLINVFNHTYLNQKPRFKKKIQKVFPLYGIKTKQDFRSILQSTQRIKERKNVKQIYQYQLKQMHASGLSENGINEILNCVQQNNYVSQQVVKHIMNWILNYIADSVSKTDDRFYDWDVQACLISLKYMIELGIFQFNQNEKIVNVIRSIVKRISQSLQLQNDVKIQLKGGNFKKLLLQMVEKNIIKRFNHSAKFDGVEDQITSQNICSQYVNYAFYQNILLMEKNSNNKKKQAVKVIVAALKLVSLESTLFIQQKIEEFILYLIVNESHLIKDKNKSQSLQDVMTKIILKSVLQDRKDVINLLLLLFYNNNKYSINYQSIKLLSVQLYGQTEFIESLSSLIFITDKEENQKYQKISKTYGQIRLLSQTSEVWLGSNYQSPSYPFNSVILFFIDRIKTILKIIVPNFRQQRWTPFDCIAGLQHSIILQRQIIASNIDFQEEVMVFIKNYRHFLMKIKIISKSNQLFVRLMKYCFVFLYTFIYNCQQNKSKMSQHIQDVSVSQYFWTLCQLEVGQSKFLIQYLKDNFQACLDFYLKYNLTLKKFNRYTQIYSKLLLTLLKYFQQPISANLKKFFINIFDFNSFKEFLWLKDGKQFELDVNLFVQSNWQPYFYHINAIDALLYLYDYLQQSANTIKNHIKKSLTQEYLFELLAADDYFTKQNSIKTILKVQVMFKIRILRIISRIYLHQASNLIYKQLIKYNKLLNVLLEQASLRQQTDDFRKIIILKDIKQDQSTRSDYKITQLYTIIFGDIYLIQLYIESIIKFASSVKKSQPCFQYHSIAETVMEQGIQILQILHLSDKIKSQKVHYTIPNELNFKITNNKKNSSQLQRKKYYMSSILQTIYNNKVYKTLQENKVKRVKLFKAILEDINLKQFLFFRKLSQFLEDAFQKLQQDNTGEVNSCLKKLLNILSLFVQCESDEKANEIRSLMGKSQLIFPLLNYFQTAVIDGPNRELFLSSLQFLNTLLGSDGNRMIQTIFNSYFTNKTDSIDFFMKIKQVLGEINFQQTTLYKCRRLYNGIETYYNKISNQKEPQFILLQFFINLCKGNCRPNQIYLGSLATISNFNITRSIWEILKSQKKYNNYLVNVQNYSRITQCLSTIRQFVEGPCVQNQNEFLKRDFFLTVLSFLQYETQEEKLQLQHTLQEQLVQISEVSNYISKQLRVYLNQDKITRNWMPSQVKYRCISLISSLMSENVNEKSMSQLLTIPIELLIKEMDRVYDRYVELKLQFKRSNLQFSQQNQVVLPLGFKIYQVLQYYPKEKLSKQSPGLTFFKENSRIVEVMHQNLTIVVFPRIQTEISQAFKTAFLQNADRTSINSKLRDLQNAEIQNRQSDYPYGYLLLFLTLLLVLFDLIIYVPDTLTFVQNFNFYSIFNTYGVNDQIERARAAILFIIVILSSFFSYLQLMGAVYMRQTIKDITQSEAPKFQKFKTIMKLLFQNLDYLHYILIVILAIFSIFNPLFDSLILVLQLFRRSQTFFIILKAIKQTLDQLCVVLLINLILTYILASILYFYYGEQYQANCATLYYCFIFALSIGFKADAGFVGMYDDVKLAENFENVSFLDVLVNFSYLFIIKVIMDQVIGAIIVDKFAQIRQQKQNLEQDENSFCFICGIQRNILDRQQDGFEKHKEEYHVIWNYMQFLIHIRQSKLGNLTGIERFVYDQFKVGKLNWFPINRSFHLQNKKIQSDEQTVNHELQIQKLTKLLDGEMNDINQHLSQMQDIINIKTLKEKKKEQK